MAKQSEGFLGGFSGRLGPAVGYRWKGIWCVRSQPRFVKNPRTEAQQQHRAMFKAEVQLAGRMRWALNIGLKLPSDELNLTPMNLFVKGNQHAFSAVDGSLAVDYPSLRISGGTVAPVAITEATLGAPASRRQAGKMPALHQGPNILNITFEKNPLRRTCSAYDNVYFWVFCEELQQGYLSNPVYRRVQRASIALPDDFQDCTLHVYAFAQDEQGRCSETAYVSTDEEVVDEEIVDMETGEIMFGAAPQGASVLSRGHEPTERSAPPTRPPE
ncbi:MAG: hypothetical protein IJ634_04975 [Bacteroidales bacterium]|nr:hypothetical protein [Bacteroidales bacterium]